MKLDDLLNLSITKAMEKLGSINSNDDNAKSIAMSAIKFADLQNNPKNNYIFNIDSMLNFEGKTGPYLLYQTMRIKAILQKLTNFEIDLSEIFINSNEDIQLSLYILDFKYIIKFSSETNSSHPLVNYLYDLAQCFSSYYKNTPKIIDEQDLRIKNTRILLINLVKYTLETGLDLMGLNIPSHM
jgi:arginyl-tRNA synthetase